jgi:AcrR family transcriptional regulator
MSAKPSESPRYRSSLRQEQAELTRRKITRAAVDLLDARGGPEGITFKAVAAGAGVTEITVYRHFPTREALLQGVWGRLNEEMGPQIGMPQDEAALIDQHGRLFAGFDRLAPQILAALSTPQGKEMRAALNEERRTAFLGIVDEAAPGLGEPERTRAAAVLQLLHSAHAWASLREQWNLDGAAAGEATRWAIETLLTKLRTKP